MSTEINEILLGIQSAIDSSDKPEIGIGLLKLQKSLDGNRNGISAADFEGVNPALMCTFLVGGLLLMASSLNS